MIIKNIRLCVHAASLFPALPDRKPGRDVLLLLHCYYSHLSIHKTEARSCVLPGGSTTAKPLSVVGALLLLLG